MLKPTLHATFYDSLTFPPSHKLKLKVFSTCANQYGALLGQTYGWHRIHHQVVLFDYRKAFDLIDHVLLARKLLALDMAISVSFWIIDFLTDRTQSVKLGEDCLSDWRNVPAGVPQGTKLGPWLFILMIDDINTTE